MNPLLKRILLHGGMTAALLAGLGLLFAELAGMWMSGSTSRSGSVEQSQATSEALRYRVPLMMAFWGFVFVVGCELVLSRFRKPIPKPQKQPDDAEKLLNELLAQAEAKMAQEAGQKAGGAEQKPEARGQNRPDAGADAKPGSTVS
jgi:hypothetical protein